MVFVPEILLWKISEHESGCDGVALHAVLLVFSHKFACRVEELEQNLTVRGPLVKSCCHLQFAAVDVGIGLDSLEAVKRLRRSSCLASGR